MLPERYFFHKSYKVADINLAVEINIGCWLCNDILGNVLHQTYKVAGVGIAVAVYISFA